MTHGYIKLEIDPAEYEKVKEQLHDLYTIADMASWKIMSAAQQSVHLTALRRGLTASIIVNVILLAVVLAIIGGR